MNLKRITDKILNTSSSFSRNQGKELAKNKSVIDLKSKKIDNTYHIYGRVLSDNKIKSYSTHIKIDINSDTILGTRCTCDTFEENRIHIRNYICKHIVATSYTFYHVAKNKVAPKKVVTPKILKKEGNTEPKRVLKLDIAIKALNINNIVVYNCEFRIGSNGTHLIMSLNDFIENEKIVFNPLFTYDYNNDAFNKSDTDVIKFIKSNKNKVNGKYLKLNQGELKSFLSLIDADKKVIFNYDFLNYEVKIKKSNAPLSLTIRCDKDSFILKPQMKFPTPLTFSGDVLFYDRDIYIPKDNQVKYYIPIYKRFMKNSEIRYPKTGDSLNTLLSELKNVTNNIILDDGTKEFSTNLMKPIFYFYKEDETLYCNVKLNYCGYILDLIKDKTSNSFLRNYKKEELIDMELERFKFIKGEKDFVFIGDEEGIYDFLSTGLNSLKTLGFVEFSKDFNDIKLIDSSEIVSNIEEFNNYYKLKYTIGDFTIKELGNAIDAMKNGERFYKYKTSYLDLEDPGMVQFLNLIDDLSNDKDLDYEIDIDKNKSIYLQEKLRNTNLSFIRGGNILQSIVEKLLNKEFKKIKVPKALNATLRNYQIHGFNWLNDITSLGFGGILADDMGLGKTIQVISFILSKKNSKTLIVTPTSVIYNWIDEFTKFAGNIKIGVSHGGKSQREKILNNYNDYDVILTTYGTLKNDEDIYKDMRFDYCIIDEGQNIKNHKAQATLSVKKIKSKCNIALTGTPIENNLMELWSIFDFIMPGFLFTKEKFREKFVAKDNMVELKSLISPFILRRLKEDVLDELPSKVEKKYTVEMTKNQKMVYKSYLKEIKNKIAQRPDKINLFNYLTKLRQLCLDPSLVIPDYIGGNGKLKVALELVQDSLESGKKILLFSQFTSVLRNIEETFKADGINYLYLDGSISAKERINLVNKFNESNDATVFLISLKAGGVGINLTSASVVIHFDPWWNPAVEDQATDRAHRFGQKNMVTVIKLVAKDTIEEKILLLQEDKKELINNLLDGKSMDGETLKKLSNEEILKLFD